MEAVKMENNQTVKTEEVKKKVQAILEQDKGKTLDEIYHDVSNDRLYGHYLKMEAGETWNR